MTDMFPETKPPRAKPRVMAHVIDAGCSCETMLARFECPRCRWESEWLPVSSVSDGKRGIPCPVCNQMSHSNRDRAAALAASVSAQRAAKAETERIEQEKSMAEKHMCCEQVHRGYWHSPCLKTAAYEHEGKWYCTIHHPPTVIAKNDARSAKWNAEREEKKKRQEEKQAAEDEIKRRADCYPNLLNALKLCALICSGQASSKRELIQALEQSRAAIKKATGETQ